MCVTEGCNNNPQNKSGKCSKCAGYAKKCSNCKAKQAQSNGLCISCMPDRQECNTEDCNNKVLPGRDQCRSCLGLRVRILCSNCKTTPSQRDGLCIGCMPDRQICNTECCNNKVMIGKEKCRACLGQQYVPPPCSNCKITASQSNGLCIKCTPRESKLKCSLCEVNLATDNGLC